MAPTATLEKKQTAEVEVQGIETFRKVTVLSALIFTVISIFMLIFAKSDCDDNHLLQATWLCFAVEASIFLLLLMHYVYCGWCIRKMGKLLMGVFYFCMTGCMCAAQVLMFNG